MRESGAHCEPRLVTEDIFFNLDQCASWETMNTLAYPAPGLRVGGGRFRKTPFCLPDG